MKRKATVLAALSLITIGFAGALIAALVVAGGDGAEAQTIREYNLEVVPA